MRLHHEFWPRSTKISCDNFSLELKLKTRNNLVFTFCVMHFLGDVLLTKMCISDPCG